MPRLTSTLPTQRRRRFLAFAGLAAGLASIFIGALDISPVHAETELNSSSPADGEKLLTAPTQIVAVFNEAIPTNSVMQAVCEGAPAPLGTVSVAADGISLVAPIVGVLPVGTCNVTYSIPQPDGKVVTAGFSFKILDPSTVDPGDVSVDDTDGGNLVTNPPPVSGPLALARVFAYIAVAVFFGGLFFLAIAWPEGIADEFALKVLRNSWAVAIVASYVVAMLRACLASGKSVTSAITPIGWGELLNNASGLAAVGRIVLLGVCFSVMMRPDRVVEPQTRLAALAVPAAAMFTFGFTRSVDSLLPMNVVASGVHAVTIGLWVGGLAMMSQAVLKAPGEADLVKAVLIFNKRAPVYVGIAVLSGLLSLYQLDSGAILSSRHGRLIVLKSAVAALMVYAGGANRQRARHLLGRRRDLNAKTAHSLARGVRSEVMFGLFAFIITSWAVATLPDTIDPPGTDKTKYAFVGDRSGGEFDVQLKVTPAIVGLNAVRIDVYSPKTGLTDLTVQFNPPTPDTASVTLSVPLDGEGAARLPLKEGIPFGAPGLWTVVVTGNGPEGPLPSVSYSLSVMASTDSSSTTVPTDSSGVTQPGDASATTLPGGSTGVVTSVAGSPATVVVPLGGNTSVP